MRQSMMHEMWKHFSKNFGKIFRIDVQVHCHGDGITIHFITSQTIYD